MNLLSLLEIRNTPEEQAEIILGLFKKGGKGKEEKDKENEAADRSTITRDLLNFSRVVLLMHTKM